MLRSIFLKKDGNKRAVYRYLTANPLFLIISALIVIIASFDISFFNIASFNTILTQSATRLMFAIAAASIIIVGGIDLSLGRIVGFAGVFAASMLQDPNYSMKVFGFSPAPLFIPIIGSMLLAASFSVGQSQLITRLKIPPFIASLGFQQIVYGSCSLYYNGVCNSNPISTYSESYIKFSQGTIKITSQFSISYLLLYAIAICFIMWFIWEKTVLGKHMFAIGGNIESAKVSGVNVNKSTMLVYMIAGLLVGFGGSLEAGRTGSAINSMGADYALDAIAACVVGGVSLRGGRGTILGVALGVIIFQILSYGLIYIGISPDLQYVVKGAIIILAVAFDIMNQKRQR